MIETKVSHIPIVLKHDFPDEMRNYIDEKIEEGQYKKRFRYDRPEGVRIVNLYCHLEVKTSTLNCESSRKLN